MELEAVFKTALGPARNAAAAVIMIAILSTLTLGAIFAVVSYVLHSLSLYTIAGKRKIANGWLSWIPVGEGWILGSIADQYQLEVRSCEKNRRKILLGLHLGALAVQIPMLIAEAAIIAEVLHTLPAVSGTLDVLSKIPEGLQQLDMSRIMVPGVVFAVCSFLNLAVIGCLLVFRYLCYYDLYTSCNPDTKQVFLVLSILIPLTIPFFLFADRKKEHGMPPRRE